MEQAQLKRQALDERTRGVREVIVRELATLAPDLFDWHAYDRGAGERAAYGETKREVDALLDSIKTEIGKKVHEVYVERRRSE